MPVEEKTERRFFIYQFPVLYAGRCKSVMKCTFLRFSGTEHVVEVGEGRVSVLGDAGCLRSPSVLLTGAKRCEICTARFGEVIEVGEIGVSYS